MNFTYLQMFIKILYGIPLPITKIADLHSLKQQLSKDSAVLRLMVDHVEQVQALKTFNMSLAEEPSPWSVFVKVESGYKFRPFRLNYIDITHHFLLQTCRCTTRFR